MADRTLTALQNDYSWRTPGLIGSYQITKNRSEIATMLIGYFFFLLFFRIESSESTVSARAGKVLYMSRLVVKYFLFLIQDKWKSKEQRPVARHNTSTRTICISQRPPSL
jgi:hypothetical protein